MSRISTSYNGKPGHAGRVNFYVANFVGLSSSLNWDSSIESIYEWLRGDDVDTNGRFIAKVKIVNESFTSYVNDLYYDSLFLNPNIHARMVEKYTRLYGMLFVQSAGNLIPGYGGSVPREYHEASRLT